MNNSHRAVDTLRGLSKQTATLVSRVIYFNNNSGLNFTPRNWILLFQACPLTPNLLRCFKTEAQNKISCGSTFAFKTTLLPCLHVVLLSSVANN